MGPGDFWALTGQSWRASGHVCPRPEQTLGLQKDVAPAEGTALPQIKTRTGAVGTQSRPPKPKDRASPGMAGAGRSDVGVCADAEASTCKVTTCDQVGPEQTSRTF